MPLENIVVRGAREHNLKNVDVTIPRNKLVVVTGVSGSGKSSLAFDTIYAEGQRRYVESLSAYARQFLGRMDKPDVDYIEGLSPAISIDQKGVSHNPRSSVGTVTEIYDYLRLLFARAGRPHCYKCRRPVQRQTVQQIVDAVMALPQDSRIQIMAPMVRRRKGEHREVFEEARRSGFVRVRVNGEVHDLSETFDLDKQRWHTIEIVVDRLVVGDSAELGRVTDSVETALKMAGGVVLVSVVDGEELLYSEQFACVHCNISVGELEPRTFSFNNPHGACPTCTGLGYKLEVDPDYVIPNKELTLDEGAIQPWVRSGTYNRWLTSLLSSLADQYGFSTKVPVKKLKKRHLDLILYGNKGKSITMTHRTRRGKTYQWDSTFEGVVNNLERRYRETESDYVRSEVERYMTSRPCQSCQGNRLKPEALAVTVCGLNIVEVSDKSITQALEWTAAIGGEPIEMDSSPTANGQEPSRDGGAAANGASPVQALSTREKAIADQILKEIDARLRFLLNIGLDYLTLSRTASTLSGGEAQRIRLATQIGSGLMGVLYVCDEPSIGLHPADDHRLIETLKRLRDLGNTVLIVEHDEAIMRAADVIVDLGPGAGEHGGHVVSVGPVETVIDTPESITGQYLGHRRRIPVPESRRPLSSRSIIIKGARENNLKNIRVKLPLGVFVCVTGVSGSGKSTLVYEVLYKKLAQHFYRAKDRPGESGPITGIEHIDKIVNIDQSPIGRTPRSNPATYTGTFTPIRELFTTVPEARVRGYKPGRFSFNVKGGALRGLQGRRLHQHRDAVPTRRNGPVRGVRRQALQSRGAGDRVQGEEHRRRAGDDGHGGPGALRQHPPDTQQAPDDVRRGAGLHTAGPARDPPERRRGPAGEAVHGALQAGHRQDHVHLGRADHRPLIRGLLSPAPSAAPSGGRRQQHRPHRAPPRPHQERRLDHRPGPRRRREGRLRRRRGHPRADGPVRPLLHWPVPEDPPRP